MTKILLVEDDTNLREIYSARLEAEGYQITSASDGEEALAVAVRERPELIISDVMMPKISGFDMLDILRSTPETKDVKVIVMTALGQEEDRKRGEQLGADRYVVKSQVTLEDVVAMVREVLAEGGAPAATPPTDNTATAAVDDSVQAASANDATADLSDDDTTAHSDTPPSSPQEVAQFVEDSESMNNTPPKSV